MSGAMSRKKVMNIKENPRKRALDHMTLTEKYFDSLVTPEDSSDEEVDESLNQQQSRSEQREHSKYQKARLKRTIFVGNLPSSVTTRALRQMFRKCLQADSVDPMECKVESVRLRGAVPTTGGTSKQARKRSSIQHEFAAGANHTLIGYVVLTSEAGISAALKTNGHLLDGRHIRVDVCTGRKTSQNNQKCIFVGNLPFSVNEEQVRQVFASFGEITSVRLVRDSVTGAVKGIGFVEFAESTSVQLAIRHAVAAYSDPTTGPNIAGRLLRVQAWKSIKKTKMKGSSQKDRSGKDGERMQGSGVRVPTNVRGAERRQFVKRALERRTKRKSRVEVPVKNKMLPKTERLKKSKKIKKGVV